MQTPRDINFLYRNLGQYKNAIISFRLKYRPYRSEYRILAGKWIPGRNKKTPLFCCRFLRNWRSLKKNKNRRSSWGFCESLKKKNFTCRCRWIKLLLLFISLVLPHELFLLLLLLANSFSPPLLFFFVIWFHPAVNNFETCGKWREMKKTRLQVHFLSIQDGHVTHVACRWCIVYTL